MSERQHQHGFLTSSQGAGELLRDLLIEPLDPAYAKAHAARAARGSDGATPGMGRRAGGVIVTATIVALGLAAGTAVVQLRSTPPSDADREALIEQIEARTAEVDTVAAANEERQAEIEVLESQLLAQQSADLAQTVARLGVVAGSTAMRGPGLEVVLDDPAPEDPLLGGGEADEDERVVPLDIILVVNGMWASGAEAVAVNGQRLTSLSPIRGAGSAILVDYRPLVPPYTVTAVGDAEAMAAEFATGRTANSLQLLRSNYGIEVSVNSVGDTEVPASSTLLLQYAQSVPPETDAPASPEASASTGAGTAPEASQSSESSGAASPSTAPVDPEGTESP